MKLSRRTKIYGVAALSLLIIPLYYFMLPTSHDEWWIGFRRFNHFIRAMAPLLTIIGYYAIFIRHKKYAPALVFAGFIALLYVFNLNFYNALILFKDQSVAGRSLNLTIGFSIIEMAYIGIVELIVTILTIIFSAEILIKYYPTYSIAKE